jgi:hypothetical protein
MRYVLTVKKIRRWNQLMFKNFNFLLKNIIGLSSLGGKLNNFHHSFFKKTFPIGWYIALASLSLCSIFGISQQMKDVNNEIFLYIIIVGF